MNVLLLGCGEIGKECLRDLYQYGPFEEIIVGTRTLDHAAGFIASLQGRPVRIRHVSLDIADVQAVAALMEGCTVAVNCAGPNFKYELPVAHAAIQAKVPLIDINDEFEITFRMYELDEAAKKAGIPIIFGLGGAPGIDNVLVRAAADQLDEVEEIHTSWIMSGADPGGHALSQHLLYSLAGRGLTKTEEGLVEIQSFRDGGEFLDYPEPIGRVEVFHIGHPEPITLSRSFPSAKIVDNKATFVPASVNQDIVSLGKRVRNEDGGILATEAFGKTMDDAATELLSRCREQADVPVEAGILVMLKGQKRGKSKKVYFSSVGKLGAATGVPAAIGAIMVAQGKINVTGCMPPELGIDAHDFLFEILDRRNLATLNGWVED